MAPLAPGPAALVAVFVGQLNLLGGWNWYTAVPPTSPGVDVEVEPGPELVCASCAPCPAPAPCSRAPRRGRASSASQPTTAPVVIGWSSGCLLNTAAVAFIAGFFLAGLVFCSCPWLPGALVVLGLTFGLLSPGAQAITPYAIADGSVPGDSDSD